MANTDLFITFVLDRSGSMANIWSDTVGGFNQYKADQVAADGDTWMTLVTFDDKVEFPFTAWNVKDLPDLTNEIAAPRGSTALFDAIGRALDDGQKWLDENSWFEGKPLLAVMTDGHENASREYKKADIAKRIAEKEAAGWTIVYMGANQDSWAEASSLGVTNAAATMDWAPTGQGVKTAYRSHSVGTQTLRSSGKYDTKADGNK